MRGWGGVAAACSIRGQMHRGWCWAVVESWTVEQGCVERAAPAHASGSSATPWVAAAALHMAQAQA